MTCGSERRIGRPLAPTCSRHADLGADAPGELDGGQRDRVELVARDGEVADSQDLARHGGAIDDVEDRVRDLAAADQDRVVEDRLERGIRDPATRDPAGGPTKGGDAVPVHAIHGLRAFRNRQDGASDQGVGGVLGVAGTGADLSSSTVTVAQSPTASSTGGPAGVGSGVGSGVALGSGVAAIVGSALGLASRGRGSGAGDERRLVLASEDREGDEADEDEGDRTCRPEADEHSWREPVAVGWLDSRLAGQRWSHLDVGPSWRSPGRHVERIERGLSLIGLGSWCGWLVRIRAREDRKARARVARVGPLGGSSGVRDDERIEGERIDGRTAAGLRLHPGTA